jgi:hypothetical protein
MRPIFVDTVLTDAGLETPVKDVVVRADRSAAYREWRRTRVLFMHSVSEAERAVVNAVADLPAQRRGADL